MKNLPQSSESAKDVQLNVNRAYIFDVVGRRCNFYFLGDVMEDQVILNNDRDRRTLAWLRQQAGDAAVIQAISDLAGSRKPYVSNLCKVLGLSPSAELEKTDRKTALTNITAIKAILKQKNKD